MPSLKRIFSIPPIGMFLRQPLAQIERPRMIDNGHNIRLGRKVYIRAYGLISAIPRWAGQTFDPRIEIGDHSYIGRHATITCAHRVTIGAECVLSDYVYIADTAHGLDPAGPPIMAQPLESKGPVTIGRRCFVGLGARILPGVTLGDHCIVGTNAVVTRSFPAYSMIAGNPARLIKRYDPATGIWQKAPPE